MTGQTVQAEQIENAGETAGCDWIWIKAKSRRPEDCTCEILVIDWGFLRFSMTDKVVEARQQREAVVLEWHCKNK